MKKFIIPIIIAAALGIGGGITAVMMNKNVSAEKNLSLPELKFGNYYLNGDTSSDMYLEVTEDHIAAKVIGKDKYEKFEELCRAQGYDDQEVDANLENHVNDYCTESKYFVSIAGYPEKMPYRIFIRFDEEEASAAVERGDYSISGMGYLYDGKNTISSSLLGDFIFVE